MPKVPAAGSVRDVFGESRKALLRHLLRHKAGATVDELSSALGVTRTAVRQHLGRLIEEGFVAPGRALPSGGRPKQLFVLTGRGSERFPRHYSWFAQLLVEAVKTEHGAAGLRTRLARIASAVVAQLRQGSSGAASHKLRVAELATLMDGLGYDARVAKDVAGMPAIEADNCIFHELAVKNPEVCQFDLALLSGFTGSKVEHHECMVRGGNVCRFRFTPRR